MSKIAYAVEKFTDAGLEVIMQAEQICDEYARQGHRLTLRQLYYRFIAGDLLPESRRDKVLGTKNTEKNYKWLGDLVSRARVGGRIDWQHITDRTRSASGGDFGWDSPESIITSSADQYEITRWDGQAHYLEVWVEKEALVDVIAGPASRWNVTHLACKGSPSTSMMHEAAVRLRRRERDGRKTHILYLGDHDPTGLDIDRDIADRLALFRSSADVTRLALTMEQVGQYDPPPSPAKVTDSRYEGYVDLYGEDCWELDALEPAVLDELVETAILGYLERDLWDQRVEREEREKVTLRAIADNYTGILQHLRDIGELADEDEEDGEE